MKKNIMDLMKLGVVVPALILSLAACGSSGSTSAPAADDSASGETAVTEEADAQEQEEALKEEAAAQQAEAEAQQEAAVTVYENGGLKLNVPADLADKVIVNTLQDNEDNVLFTVHEKASVEAQKALGVDDDDHAGWLFSIGTMDEEHLHQMLCYDMSGSEVIGFDAEGNYYMYYHPTDVSYVRETVEQMQEDQAQWEAVSNWASDMQQTFITDNGLTVKTYGNSDPEMYLARTAFEKGLNYTISTTEYGPLSPDGVDPLPYYERLTDGASVEYCDEEAPDGEYVVLDFPDEEVRFDFFKAEGKENYIRRVYKVDGEEFEILYKVTYTDDSKKASEIMQEWYDALAENR